MFDFERIFTDEEDRDVPVNHKLFVVDRPVPSLMVWKIYYEEGEWLFGYLFEFPKEKAVNGTYLSGNLCSMTFVNDVERPNINLPLEKDEQVFEMMWRQRESDLLFRKLFLENNPYARNVERTSFTVSNRTQMVPGKLIVEEKSRSDRHTTFIGRDFI